MHLTISGSRVALVLSGIALVFALGGTAYAVNTVRSADIVDGTIQSRDIGTNQVRSTDLKDGTVVAADLNTNVSGRLAAAMGRIDGSTGTFLLNRGLSSVVRNSTGRYTIQAGRDVTSCIAIATVRDSERTIAVDEASSTAVNVYIDLVSEAPADENFDIVLYC